MAEASARARIAAPAERVWRTLTDVSSHPRWSATHTGFRDGGPRPPETGAGYQENVNREVTAVDPGRGFEITGKGAGELKDTVTAALHESPRELAGLVG